MARSIDLNSLTFDDKKNIKRKLSLNDLLHIFEFEGEEKLILPFHFAKKYFKKNFYLDFEYGNIQNQENLIKLYPKQEKLFEKALTMLKKKKSIVISAEPGFGKTILAIKFISLFDLPTIIFIKQTILQKQWQTSLQTFLPNKKIKIIKKISELESENNDICIINPIILKNIFDTRFLYFKLMIVDEMHLLITEKNHKAFFKFFPKYLIGLSATPYRPENDEFEKLIPLFFGKNNFVKNNFSRNHNVVVVETKFSPIMKTQEKTKQLDWNFILQQQAENFQRNVLICKVIKHFPDLNWLILVKRKIHAINLQKILNIPCEILIGNKNFFEKECKILIGTIQKIGVGFDHPKINALCIAADVVEYFEQFLGRCMRTPDTTPLVIDFQDDNHVLEKHLDFRIEKYKKIGGLVVKRNFDFEN
jgi:superfamily II DNA or RNA helicase